MSVFISYSTPTGSLWTGCRSGLLNENIKVWRGAYKLAPGDSVTARIGDAIERASFLERTKEERRDDPRRFVRTFEVPGRLALRPLTPALSPEYRGEGT